MRKVKADSGKNNVVNLEYEIKDLHTNSRYPGRVYAKLYDPKGYLVCSATLEYCCARLSLIIEKGLTK